MNNMYSLEQKKNKHNLGEVSFARVHCLGLCLTNPNEASSFAGSMYQAHGGSFAESNGGGLLFSTVSGGVTSELSGEAFWRGAVRGGIIHLVNHMGGELFSPKLYLEFNGKELVVYKDGKVILRIDAVSGRPTESGSFDYSEARQRMESIGPIPEGKYTISPDKIQAWKNQGPITKTLALGSLVGLKAGRWPGGTFAWGYNRVDIVGYSPIRPNGGFTIHGGWFPGSAGCIDIGMNDVLFFSTILKYSRKQPIFLYINYK